MLYISGEADGDDEEDFQAEEEQLNELDETLDADEGKKSPAHRGIGSR